MFANVYCTAHGDGLLIRSICTPSDLKTRADFFLVLLRAENLLDNKI